jgi:DNA-3-methyladenine glycosylase
MASRRATRSFFDRSSVPVARDLVGMILQRRMSDGSLLRGRIVETEAYLGDGSDPGAHSHRGITPRTRSMFGPPGRLYVYRSYGIHNCMNVVCESEGKAAAVLLRAVEPIAGVAAMRALRGLKASQSDRLIARGPGRLAQAFAIELEHDGTSLLRGEFALYLAPEPCTDLRIESGRRVGLSKGADLPHRFFEADSPWVSAWRPGKPRKRAT